MKISLRLICYIERLGTGTGDIIRLCKEAGLKEPEFYQEDIFKTVIWRTTGQVTRQVTGQADEALTEYIKRVVRVLSGEQKRAEIQEVLELKHRETFVENYLNPSLDGGYIEMTYPDSPNHPQQRYRLTSKGIELREKLKRN